MVICENVQARKQLTFPANSVRGNNLAPHNGRPSYGILVGQHGPDNSPGFKLTLLGLGTLTKVQLHALLLCLNAEMNPGNASTGRLTMFLTEMVTKMLPSHPPRCPSPFWAARKRPGDSLFPSLGHSLFV